MSYAIVGFGKIGQALAHAFARKNIDVTVASRRPPEALAPQARAIGPTVVAKSLREALEADTIILAVPFARLRRPCRAGKARRSSTRRTRFQSLKSWTVSPPPPSWRRRSPAPGSSKGSIT
jgi:3-hydroxyisobutyrate dehydrogenase-like beta-hydroxyacid dehydrogenase